MRDKYGRFLKGHHSSPKTEFKKGHRPIAGFKKGNKGFWKGKKFSKEHRKNLSDAFMGRKGYWKGKKRPANMYKKIVKKRRDGVGYIVSKETRKKIGDIHRGKIREKSPNWRGGKHFTKKGYILIYKPEHPLCNNHRYIRQSRLIMEKHLGRYLTRREVVHHINDIKNDDRIENLKLFPNNSEHIKFHKNHLI